MVGAPVKRSWAPHRRNAENDRRGHGIATSGRENASDQPGWSNCRIVSEREEYFFRPWRIVLAHGELGGELVVLAAGQLCKIAVGGRRLGLRLRGAATSFPQYVRAALGYTRLRNAAMPMKASIHAAIDAPRQISTCSFATS